MRVNPETHPDSDSDIQPPVNLCPERPRWTLGLDDDGIVLAEQLEHAALHGARHMVHSDRHSEVGTSGVTNCPRDLSKRPRLRCPNDQSSQCSFRDVAGTRKLGNCDTHLNVLKGQNLIYWIGGCGLVTITVTSQLITRVGLFCESHPPGRQPGSGCHPGRDCLKHRHLVIRNQRHGIRTMTAAPTHPRVFCLPVPNTHPWVAYTQAGVTRAVPRTDKTEEKAAMPRAGEWAAQK